MKLYPTEEWTDEEKEIYYRGQARAYVSILCLLDPSNKDVWDKYLFNLSFVERAAGVQIEALLTRLDKAKKVYKTQQRIIDELSQVTID